MLDAVIAATPISGWVVLYLLIGWIYTVIDIVRNYTHSEEEITIRIVLWPIFIAGTILLWVFHIIFKGARATERVASAIREFRRES